MERTANFLPIPGFSSVYTHKNVPNDHKVIFFILHAAAHVKFHLLRQNPAQPLKKLVDLELYRLSGTVNPLQQGPDLLSRPAESQTNWAIGCQANLVFDTDALYGITLHNHSPYDLFPFLFVFDLETYQVYGWYKPASGTALPPLQKVNMALFGALREGTHLIYRLAPTVFRNRCSHSATALATPTQFNSR